MSIHSSDSVAGTWWEEGRKLGDGWLHFQLYILTVHGHKSYLVLVNNGKFKPDSDHHPRQRFPSNYCVATWLSFLSKGHSEEFWPIMPINGEILVAGTGCLPPSLGLSLHSLLDSQAVCFSGSSLLASHLLAACSQRCCAPPHPIPTAGSFHSLSSASPLPRRGPCPKALPPNSHLN